MLNIKKIDKTHYSATLENNTELVEVGRSIAFLIKKELSSYVKPNREIVFDITGVKSINVGGLNMMHELINKAITRRCRIEFINVDPLVASTIDKLTGKMAAHRKKSSAG